MQKSISYVTIETPFQCLVSGAGTYQVRDMQSAVTDGTELQKKIEELGSEPRKHNHTKTKADSFHLPTERILTHYDL